MRDRLKKAQTIIARLSVLPYVPNEVVQALGDLSALLSAMVDEIEKLKEAQHANQ